MATKDKGRKSKKKGKAGKRRVVVRRARKRPARKRKAPAGTGVFGSHFPTNRTIDSNQYWQLRAEIAGTEARVRSRLKDRQADYDRSEANITKIQKQVKEVMTPEKIAAAARNVARDQVHAGPGTPATPPINVNVIGEAHHVSTQGEYEAGARRAGARRARSRSRSGSAYKDSRDVTPSPVDARKARRGRGGGTPPPTRSSEV
eukprot:COSAG04_NODE_533_length_12959_cov_8.218497_13_plen_203_part_00